MLQSCRLRSIACHRGGGGLGHRRLPARQRREQAAAVDVAACAQHCDRGQPIRVAGIVGEQQRGGARLLHATLHPGVAFVRQCAFQRRQRGRVMRMEHRLGRVEACGRIRREHAQTAECRLDLATDRIVHAHLPEAARHDVRRRLAGRRIDERAIIGLDEQRLVGGASEQAIVLQRRQDGGSLRMAGQREHADALPDRLEARRGQRRERIVGRLRTARHGCQCQCGDQQQAGETLHRRAFRKRLGVARGGSGPPPWGWSAQAIMPSCRHLLHTCRS